jgi:hypothetical protein
MAFESRNPVPSRGPRGRRKHPAGRPVTLRSGHVRVLAFPPLYRAAPGSPVYVIHAGDRAVLVGEQDLTGLLRDLVTTILAAGDPP